LSLVGSSETKPCQFSSVPLRRFVRAFTVEWAWFISAAQTEGDTGYDYNDAYDDDYDDESGQKFSYNTIQTHIHITQKHQRFFSAL